ncbi:MAG: MFS transporter [Nannocystaceae bacterium]|nr:MFS transporter [Nannocystaceae bacterium]
MTGWRTLPRSVWALGLVSLLMDLSSETIHALLPTFLALELGASMVTIGVLDGVAEAIASGLKIVSGAWSDRSGRRKRLAVIGYGLSAASKPAFALAAGIVPIAIARAVDRIGKGIRGAPRDALIADVTPPAVRGAAYGLRQSLDTIGAVLGPLCAMAWMLAAADGYRLAFAFAVVPAVAAVALLGFAVREPEQRSASAGKGPLRWQQLRELDRGVLALLLVAALVTIARATEGLLVLATVERGLGVPYSPLVLVAMNVIYSAAAYPAGRLADRWPRARLLLLGIALLLAAQLVLAIADSVALCGVGLLLYGAHMAASQGLLSAWIAALAPAHLRGTAFGLLHLTTGLAAIVAGALAGACWAAAGPPLAFATAAAIAVLAAAALWLARARLHSPANDTLRT